MGRLDGKVAFITGVGRGQGRSHAIRLAEEGADIVGVDSLTDVDSTSYAMATQEDLDETRVLVEKTGRRAILSRADVRDREELQRAVTSGVSELGRLDIVCANAGIMPIGRSIWEISPQQWQDVTTPISPVCSTRWPSRFRRYVPPATVVQSSSQPLRRRCGSSCISATTRRPRPVSSPWRKHGQ